MLRVLTAATLVTMAGAGMAQQVPLLAGVTVYGNLDLGARIDTGATGTGNAGNAVRFDDGLWTTSRIGIKAERDIGDGLTVNAEVQGTVVADGSGTGTNSSFSFDRLSVVGLRSTGWGYLNLGNQYTPMHRHVIKFNAAAYDGFAGANNSSGLIRIATRRANQVNYQSPKWGGFSADLQVARGESSITSAGQPVGNATALGLGYEAGPVMLGAAFETQKAAAGTKDFSNQSVGARYDAGFAKFFVITGAKKGGVAQTAADYDIVASTLGVQVPLAGGTLAASVGAINSRGVANADATTFGVNYRYPLAKGVDLYAMYGAFTNKNGGTRVLKGGSGASGLFTSANTNSGSGSKTIQSLGVGINLYF